MRHLSPSWWGIHGKKDSFHSKEKEWQLLTSCWQEASRYNPQDPPLWPYICLFHPLSQRFYRLPKQWHQLGNKCSDAWASGGLSHIQTINHVTLLLPPQGLALLEYLQTYILNLITQGESREPQRDLTFLPIFPSDELPLPHQDWFLSLNRATERKLPCGGSVCVGE